MIAPLLLASSLALGLIQSPASTILPGVVDLPVVEGSKPSADCLGLRTRLAQDGDPFECLETTYEDANRIAFAYVRAAETAGWAHDGGAANALWLRRTMADGVCQRLTVAGFPGPDDRAPRAAVVLVSLDADVRCPRPNAAP